MDNKQTSKKSSKKSVTSSDKNNNKTGNKKKKKNRKSANKSDQKDSDQSPDILEIEGLGALDNTQGVDSDSSHAYQEPASRGDENASKNRLENAPTAVEVESKKASSSGLQINVSSMSIKPSKSQDSIRELQVKENSSAMLSKQRSMISKNNKYKVNITSNSSLKPGYQFGAKSFPRRNNSSSNLNQMKNESLRWENPAEGSDEEEERIKLYKINRRKRYLAAAQAKGLGWAANYKNGTPVTEDSGIESKDSRVTGRNDNHSLSDFSPMKSLAPVASNSGMAMVEC